MFASRFCLSLTPLCCFVLTSGLAAGAGPGKVRRALEIAPVWSGHPVGFCLLTAGEHQFAAFYDAERRMTVGARKLDSAEWRLVRLPEKVGWDSHNSIVMAADDDGFLHLSGNMHCVPLVYFRTARPWDTESFERVPAMIGSNEKRCTYPRFLGGPKGELLYTYRDGSSGNGDQIYNVYDLKTRTWRRWFDGPMVSGEGLMNAYFCGPVRDADGMFHLCWVWRDTPDCATNHDLSYARSKDLRAWETGAGRPLTLPITLKTAEIVDPVPAGGGIINSNLAIGFDTRKRPVLTYHKFDVAGKTQLCNARLEDGKWKVYQTSNWDYRWEFKGGGTILSEIGVSPVTVEPDGKLSQAYRHVKLGSGVWQLDEATLKPTGTVRRKSDVPGDLHKVESKTPGMSVRFAYDGGKGGAPGVRYVMRWETLGPNRDRPREGPPPPPSMLRVYELTE